MRVADGLGAHDGGVPFGLGDCRRGGDHKWGAGRFLFDGPTLPGFGRYTFRRVQVKEAMEFVRGGVVALVSTCTASMFFGLALRIPVSWDHKVDLHMDPGDEALAPIFPGPAPTHDTLVEYGVKDLKYELGILKRTD